MVFRFQRMKKIKSQEKRNEHDDDDDDPDVSTREPLFCFGVSYSCSTVRTESGHPQTVV